MKKTFTILGLAFTCCQVVHAQSGTFSTPAYNGTGARSSATTPNNRTSTNFNSRQDQNLGISLGSSASTNFGTSVNASLGTNNGTSLGTSLGTNNGTALGTSLGTNNGTVLGQPNTAIGQQGTTAIGQQSTTAIGQQGTTAIGQQGTGTAITPQPQTNAFIVNSDGTVAGVPAQGGSSGTALGGTNTGSGTVLGTQQTNNFKRSP